MTAFIVFVMVALTKAEPVRYALLIIVQIKEAQMFLVANELNTAVPMFICAKMINVERRIYGQND